MSSQTRPTGPLPSPNSSQEDPPAYSERDAEVLFSDFHSAPSVLEPLRLPLCVPQATAGATSLFTRAYTPELRASGVELDDWIHFVDALNIAMTASPPLRVVDAAGLIIGFVPHHWAQVASVGIQAAAKTGIHIISKTLSDRLLRRANAEYFAPRGLRVRLFKTAAMRRLVGLDRASDAAAPSKLSKYAKTAGRTAETVALHLPVMRGVYNRIAPSVPAVDPHAPEQMAVRRLLALQGYVLPVSFDVPPPAQLEGLMDKASGLSVRIQAWRVRQTETKAAHKRHLLAISEGRATSLPPRQSSSSSQNVFKQVFDWGVDQKRWKDEKKAQFNAHIGREDRRLREDVEVADRKEWNATKNLLWIVVVNAEQDTLIEGTEIVDSAADEEQIPDDEWRAEILAENEADSYMLNL